MNNFYAAYSFDTAKLETKNDLARVPYDVLRFKKRWQRDKWVDYEDDESLVSGMCEEMYGKRTPLTYEQASELVNHDFSNHYREPIGEYEVVLSPYSCADVVKNWV